MDAYRAVVDKRDQRAFLDKRIADEALRRILQAGRMTGSSKNREPNRFVVVRDRACLAAVAALNPMARWVARAALAVVIVQTERHEFDAGRCEVMADSGYSINVSLDRIAQDEYNTMRGGDRIRVIVKGGRRAARTPRALCMPKVGSVASQPC